MTSEPTNDQTRWSPRVRRSMRAPRGLSGKARRQRAPGGVAGEGRSDRLQGGGQRGFQAGRPAAWRSLAPPGRARAHCCVKTAEATGLGHQSLQLRGARGPVTFTPVWRGQAETALRHWAAATVLVPLGEGRGMFWEGSWGEQSERWGDTAGGEVPSTLSCRAGPTAVSTCRPLGVLVWGEVGSGQGVPGRCRPAGASAVWGGWLRNEHPAAAGRRLWQQCRTGDLGGLKVGRGERGGRLAGGRLGARVTDMGPRRGWRAGDMSELEGGGQARSRQAHVRPQQRVLPDGTMRFSGGQDP